MSMYKLLATLSRLKTCTGRSKDVLDIEGLEKIARQLAEE